MPDRSWLLKRVTAFDLTIRFFEKLIDQCIELIFFKDRGGMPGVRNDPTIRPGNILCNQYGMLHGNDVVISSDHQGRALDLV